MSSRAIRRQIEERTRQAFGKAIWPHLFRDCAVTELVDSAPDEIGIEPEALPAEFRADQGPSVWTTSSLAIFAATQASTGRATMRRKRCRMSRPANPQGWPNPRMRPAEPIPRPRCG